MFYLSVGSETLLDIIRVEHECVFSFFFFVLEEVYHLMF